MKRELKVVMVPLETPGVAVVLIQIDVEVADPDVVTIGDLPAFADTGKAKWKARVVLDFVRLYRPGNKIVVLLKLQAKNRQCLPTKQKL